MKDTYETYETSVPEKTDGVLAYEAEQRRIALRKERDGAAVMSVMVPLWSAADPTSKLSRMIRLGQVFCVGAPLLFALAVALGYV